MTLNIISTGNNNFGYAVYSSRAKKGKITLTHGSPNSVVFEILSLQKADEGGFECSVINPESRYNGSYAHTTEVKGKHPTPLLY